MSEQIARITQALRLFWEPGDVHELRALGVPERPGADWIGTHIGYFDSPVGLAEAAAQIDAKGAKGIYFTPNPVNPSLLARATNRTRRAGRGEGTKNEEVEARRFCLLDFDPVRPAGISATDAEFDCARERAEAVRDYLAAEGWPEPLLAASGNGAHLVYRVDLPADDGGLLEACTKAVAARFSDDAVDVDESVHNAARIWKVYGTHARKGDPTEDRPHRMARVLSAPDLLQPVPGELLEALSAERGEPEPDRREPHPSSHGDGLDAETVRDALRAIPARPRYEEWVRIIAAVLHALRGDVRAAEALLREWSPEETEGEYAEKLENPLQHVTTGTLVHLAREQGWVPPWESNGRARKKEHSGQRSDAAEPPAPIGVLVSGVERESIAWLWPGRLALGKLTILDGDPGLGKSTLYCDLAARITRGTEWPDGLPVTEPGGVVIVTTEDGIADTIRPRLEEAGADLERVSVVQLIPEAEGPGRVPVLPDDAERLFGECQRVGARLLVIDPLMAHLGSDTNSYRDQDVRRALAPVSEAAERHGIAVVVLRHLNKATGGSAIYRGGGSIGIIGAARVALMVGLDPDDDTRVVLACSKNNIARRPDSLTFRLVSSERDPGTAVIRWEGTSPLSAEDLCRPVKAGTARDDAAEWLEAFLDGGPRPSADVFVEGAETGHSKKTLYRAKEELGIEARKQGFDGGWEWVLPGWEERPKIPKVATPGGGHLGKSSGDGEAREAGTPMLSPASFLPGAHVETPEGAGTVRAAPAEGRVSVDVDGLPFSFPVDAVKPVAPF